MPVCPVCRGERRMVEFAPLAADCLFCGGKGEVPESEPEELTAEEPAEDMEWPHPDPDEDTEEHRDEG